MMGALVRVSVPGESVPFFVILGLAVIGTFCALLTVDALVQHRLSAVRTTLAVEPDGSPEPATPPDVGSEPSSPGDVLVEVAAPVAEATRAPDCPDFPRFSFRIGRSKPIDPLYDEVRRLIDWLERHPEAVLVIEGHADATGVPKRNLSLSYDRAESVAALFISQGLDRERMDVEAYGAFRPIERRDGPSAVDRRVSLRTGGKPVCPHRQGGTP